MPYSHLLAHTAAHHLAARFLPNERVRLILMAVVSAALMLCWLYFRNENAWRGFEIACAPVVEALCHLGAHETVAAEVAESAAVDAIESV